MTSRIGIQVCLALLWTTTPLLAEEAIAAGDAQAQEEISEALPETTETAAVLEKEPALPKVETETEAALTEAEEEVPTKE